MFRDRWNLYESWKFPVESLNTPDDVKWNMAPPYQTDMLTDERSASRRATEAPVEGSNAAVPSSEPLGNDRSVVTKPVNRRSVLRTLGAGSSLLGAGLLAGCAGIGSGNEPASETVPPAVDDWLADGISYAANYDGHLVDLRGKQRCTVSVGAEGNLGNFAFTPPAIRISLGTEVVWQWTGNGGAHNVVAKDGAFTSGPPETGSTITFSRTFERAGTYLYYCAPHRVAGMKGAVVVTAPQQ